MLQINGTCNSKVNLFSSIKYKLLFNIYVIYIHIRLSPEKLICKEQLSFSFPIVIELAHGKALRFCLVTTNRCNERNPQHNDFSDTARLSSTERLVSVPQVMKAM